MSAPLEVVAVKRSRWDRTSDASATLSEVSSKRARSRWGERPVSNAAECAQLSARINELTRMIAAPDAYDVPTSSAPRSPSPEPVYDSHGLRTNTRSARLVSRWTKERADSVERLLALSPSYQPPIGYKKNSKLERKMYIPQDRFPQYNFIGLIIGPRGNTQKALEKQSGARIVIRGKGSTKEGRNKTKADATDNEDIHVLITADDQTKLDAAAALIAPLLVPVDETANTHKSAQLRQLAEINGTLRDDTHCRLCNQLGHKQFACPQRRGPNVRCARCNATSHVTADCTADAADAESEYNNFIKSMTQDARNDKHSPPTQEMTSPPQTTPPHILSASINPAPYYYGYTQHPAAAHAYPPQYAYPPAAAYYGSQPQQH